MQQIAVDYLKAVDLVQLDREMAAAFGAVYVGMSTFGVGRPIAVFLTDDAVVDDAQIELARSVLAKHVDVAPVPVVSLEDRFKALDDRLKVVEGKVKL